jgi:hypothetical protein
MLSNRLPHRRIAWLLVVALLVATLAPWAAATRAAASGLPGLHDLCISDPSAAAASTQAPGEPAGPATSGHCPLCVLHGGPSAPPPTLEPVLRVPLAHPLRATADTLPPARETAARWAASPPRAPPLLG